MAPRTKSQQQRLMQLAELIEGRSEPLGVGVNHQCWAGVARDVAREHGSKIPTYYGLTGDEIKSSVIRNNLCQPRERNDRMVCETRRLATA